MKILWGDIHNHCNISYGFGSLDHALERAQAQLDFCAVTGHAMWPDMYERNEETAFVVDFHREGFAKLRRFWPEVLRKVEASNGPDFTTFHSFELHSNEFGDHHIVSTNPDLPIYEARSPREIVEGCGKNQTIAVPHHIAYPATYRGIDWAKFDPEVSPIVEVFSKHGCSMSETAPYPYYHNMGPRDSHNTVYEGLKQGHHFGFVASTDHHAGYPGSYGDGRMAVLAEANNREAIIKAVRERRTYAVTGDFIRCDFKINDAPMGSILEDAKRRIALVVETEYSLDKIVVYKNLKPFHILGLMDQASPEPAYKNRYKLRLEMGWGKAQKYRWQGEMKLEGGQIIRVTPYLRGQSVLAPIEGVEIDSDAVNEMASEIKQLNHQTLSWSIDTVGNVSPVHPSTSSILVEFEAELSSILHFNMQGKDYRFKLEELLAQSFVDEVKPYHSNAFKIHRIYPSEQSLYRINLEDVRDDRREGKEDIYHVEVSQLNNQHAFVTPIWVR